MNIQELKLKSSEQLITQAEELGIENASTLRLISATALTPGDFDSQEDFEDNVLERLEVQKNFLLINKFLDNQINFAQPHIPKKK